jgi:hypothetical protein
LAPGGNDGADEKEESGKYADAVSPAEPGAHCNAYGGGTLPPP